MDENKLKQLWLSSSHEQHLAIDVEKLIETSNNKIIKMENKIKRRDRLEIIVAACMIAFFGWWLITAPQVLTKIGAVIIILTCIVTIMKLLLAKRISIKEDAASAMKYHLIVSLERVRKQKNLLTTIFWWYLLPFFIGVVCFFYSSSATIIYKVIYTIAVATLYGYIYFLNKKAVRKHLNPLENDLVKALKELSDAE